MTNVSRRDFLKKLAKLAGALAGVSAAAVVVPAKSAPLASDTMFQYKGHSPLTERYYNRYHSPEWFSPFMPEVETGEVNYETHPI